MMVLEETEVPLAALPVDAFKAHLRHGTGFAEDGLQDEVLEGFLRAALSAIEARTGKVLIARAFELILNGWRDATGQALPLAPVVSIEAVITVAQDGAETVLPPVLYRLERDSQRPRLMPVSALLPMVPRGGAVRVLMTAGMAPAWGGLPADLRQAVLLLAAHYYEYRDDTALSAGCMPFGVSTLIERYRTVRLLGGGGLT